MAPVPLETNRLAPLYGDVAADGTSIEEILSTLDDISQMRAAAQAARRIASELTLEIEDLYPDIASTAMPTETAVAQSASGQLVLSVSSSGGKSATVYVPCPPEYAENMAELQLIVLTIVNSPKYFEASVADWAGELSEESAEKFHEAVPKPDGSGFYLLDAQGDVLREVYYNIPGRV